MRLNRFWQNERGDTIIEVLFAVTVFAMVAVGTLTIMNQGTATAQRSLEITLVREQIDAQAEAIRYIHQAYVTSFQVGVAPTGAAAEWVKMTNKSTGKGANQASAFGQTTGTACPATTPGERPFILNARKATILGVAPAMVPPTGISLPPFAQVQYSPDPNPTFNVVRTYGIWIEAVPSTLANATGFVDFHIRACWESPGSSVPVTLGTIVRLYEPR
jgi:type II secretory pathway pseudopilin PulG